MLPVLGGAVPPGDSAGAAQACFSIPSNRIDVSSHCARTSTGQAAVSRPEEGRTPDVSPVPLATVLREWGRIGCIGFGGPPAHIRLLRQLCVERRGWLGAREFEDAIAVCNLMPGPASTQLAIFCAWRLRGWIGALIGGAGFIIPGLVVILALSVLFVAGSPPLWVLGAGAGAGAAVPAVAVQAGWSLLVPSWRNRASALRWLLYLAAGLAGAATIGAWLVLVLLGCGAIELLARHGPPLSRERAADDGAGRGCTVSSPLPPLCSRQAAGSLRQWRGWRSRSVPCRSAAGS